MIGANPKAWEAARYAFILLALAGLAGCVSGTTTFHSPDGRLNVVCHGAGFWWVPGTTASSEYHACREAQLKSGYIEGPVPVRPTHSPTFSPGPS
jgi:hypothetical protein